MQNRQEVQHVVRALRNSFPAAGARVALVLGTGLGKLAESLENRVAVPYTDLPGFPHSTVPSHAGRFLFGLLAGVPVVIQQGRCHLYEGYTPEAVCMGVRVMWELGARSLLITNSAGGLVPHWKRGDLMIMSDHLNLTGKTPLAGPNQAAWGERFPSMVNAYDPVYRQLAADRAAALGIRVEQGVYAGVYGPQMETPAETRALIRMGAQAVGMSTVLEVIAARHLGMRVLGISCLSNINLPDCMADVPLEEIVRVAEAAGRNLEALLRSVLPRL